ncbi:MAG: PTS transporter subunit EIIC [Bacillota bacterium]
MLKKIFTNEFALALEQLFAKQMLAASDNRYMKAVQAGSGMMLYGFFAASVFSFAALFPINTWQQLIAPLKAQLLLGAQLLIGLSSISGAFGASFNLAKHYCEQNRKLAPMATAIFSTLAFIMTLPWQLQGSLLEIDLMTLSANGFFSALIIGIISVELYRFVQKAFGEFKAPTNLPAKVLQTFFNPLSGLAVLAFWWFVKYLVFANFMDFTFSILQPVVDLFATPWLAGTIFLLDRFLWQFGIHGSTLIGALMSPLWAKMSIDNIASVSSGSQILHICSNEFINYYPRVSFLPAILAMYIFGKSRLRTLAKVSWPSALFNVAEPIMFGLPLVMNPYCVLPWLFGSLFLFVLDYFAVLYNFAPAPFLNVPWTTPHIFMAYLGTAGSFRALLLSLLNNIIMFIFWIPAIVLSVKRNQKEQL